jgi:putative transposase
MDIKSGRGDVYTIWCVKYRHRILNRKIETKLIELLKQIANDNGFTIVE